MGNAGFISSTAGILSGDFQNETFGFGIRVEDINPALPIVRNIYHNSHSLGCLLKVMQDL